MAENEPVDYEALRQRFPWVGLAHTDETDLSARYREIQARAPVDVAAIETTNAARHGA